MDVRKAVEYLYGPTGVFELDAEAFVALAHSGQIEAFIGRVRGRPLHFLGRFAMNPARFEDRDLHRQREILVIRLRKGSAQLELGGTLIFQEGSSSSARDSVIPSIAGIDQCQSKPRVT